MAIESKERVLEVDEELLDDLHELIQVRDNGALQSMLIDLHAADIAQLLQYLTEDDRHYVLGLLHDDVIGDIVLDLPEEQREDFLEDLAPKRISSIVESMSTDDAADIVSELDEGVAEEVLSNLELTDQEATEEIRDLLRYSEDTAGGRMTTDYVAVQLNETVAASIERIRQFAQETELEVYALYVVDSRHRLMGIVRLQDLVLRSPSTSVSMFMLTDIITVAPDEDQALVAQVMQRYDLIAVPVIDEDQMLLGIVTFDDIADIIEDEASEDMRYLAGVIDEDSPMTSPLLSIRRRLPWLVINLATAFLASLVVSQFEGTIQKVRGLAALMPIVAGMGGNAAIQTITVMVRSFALGDLAGIGRMRVIVKESTVGLLNGLTLGIMTGGIVWVLWGRWELGALIAVAMLANMIMAGIAGAVIPILLHKLKFDPALSSGPIVTTLTDVCGFFVFLGLATLALSWLLTKGG